MRVRCPSCELVVEVADSEQKIKCPNCGFKAPAPPPGGMARPVPAPAAPALDQPLAPTSREVPTAPRVPPSPASPGWIHVSEIQPAAEPAFAVSAPARTGTTKKVAIWVGAGVGGIVLLLIGSAVLSPVLERPSDPMVPEMEIAVEHHFATSEAAYEANPGYGQNLDYLTTLYDHAQAGTAPTDDPLPPLDELSAGGAGLLGTLQALEPPTPAVTYHNALVGHVQSTLFAAYDWSYAYSLDSGLEQDEAFVVAADSTRGLCSSMGEVVAGLADLESWYGSNPRPVPSTVDEVFLRATTTEALLCAL